MDTKRSTQGRWTSFLQALTHIRNQSGFDTPRLTQRVARRLKRVNSNATDFVRHVRHSISSWKAPLLAELPLYPNNYKTYLCSYVYEGKSWSVEIKATSFEDAENRLKALAKGKVEMEVVLTIPIPIHQERFVKIKEILKLFMTNILGL